MCSGILRHFPYSGRGSYWAPRLRTKDEVEKEAAGNDKGAEGKLILGATSTSSEEAGTSSSKTTSTTTSSEEGSKQKKGRTATNTYGTVDDEQSLGDFEPAFGDNEVGARLRAEFRNEQEKLLKYTTYPLPSGEGPTSGSVEAGEAMARLREAVRRLRLVDLIYGGNGFRPLLPVHRELNGDLKTGFELHMEDEDAVQDSGAIIGNSPGKEEDPSKAISARDALDEYKMKMTNYTKKAQDQIDQAFAYAEALEAVEGRTRVKDMKHLRDAVDGMVGGAHPSDVMVLKSLGQSCHWLMQGAGNRWKEEEVPGLREAQEQAEQEALVAEENGSTLFGTHDEDAILLDITIFVYCTSLV